MYFLKSGLHISSIVITACFNTVILLFVVVRFVFIILSLVFGYITILGTGLHFYTQNHQSCRFSRNADV